MESVVPCAWRARARFPKVEPLVFSLRSLRRLKEAPGGAALPRFRRFRVAWAGRGRDRDGFPQGVTQGVTRTVTGAISSDAASRWQVWPFWPGLRQSHLQLLLRILKSASSKGEAQTEAELRNRRCLWAASLERCGPRLKPGQVLEALEAVAVGSLRESLPGFMPLLRTHVEIARQPLRLVRILGLLRENEGESGRAATSVLQLVQHCARHLSEKPQDFGTEALSVFCALAKAAGRAAFRKLSEEDLAKLSRDVAQQAGLGGLGGPGESVRSKAADAAELFCTLARLGSREGSAELLSWLCGFLNGRMAGVPAEMLAPLARALGKGDPHEEYVLLHAICQQVLCVGLPSASAAASMLLACSKWEFYDDAVFMLAAESLNKGVHQIPPSHLCDLVYAVSNLQIRDALPLDSLDALCDDLVRRVEALSEADLVRLLRGLLKLRHQHEPLLAALRPVVMEQQARIQSISLCNLINVFSYFGGLDSESQKSLLDTAVGRARRLQPVSVQHLLTALCRLRTSGSSDSSDSELLFSLEKLCQHIAACGVVASSGPGGGPGPFGTFSPVQAVSSLAALAKLQQRDLAALSVLLGALTGTICWTWAPSPHFLRTMATPCEAFGSGSGRRTLEGLGSSHCVEILQSLAALDLSSRTTVQLTALLCGLLCPQLHELRAKELLVVARAFSVERLPDSVWASEASEASEWRERALELCLESLRRHESFLDSSWVSLLPFKLLCLQVNSGTFGTREFRDFLNPMLFSFVERLRCLTKEQCDQNRLQREGEETLEEEDPLTMEGPEMIRGSNFRIFVGSCVQSLPVDVVLCAADSPG
ncbi:unnamed protein product [Symbiodinium necroappetens]|uniref:Uncharacterized protein n=1 Tax=Symbiodinium necroappetens TaxID=1628268 RepID=A0A812N3L0_9DINO|nr:unnamed protein product [Symbiodinium necroappetens]